MELYSKSRSKKNKFQHIIWFIFIAPSILIIGFPKNGYRSKQHILALNLWFYISFTKKTFKLFSLNKIFLLKNWSVWFTKEFQTNKQKKGKTKESFFPKQKFHLTKIKRNKSINTPDVVANVCLLFFFLVPWWCWCMACVIGFVHGIGNSARLKVSQTEL